MVLGVCAEQIFLISTLATPALSSHWIPIVTLYVQTNPKRVLRRFVYPRHGIILFVHFVVFWHHVDRGALTQHHRGEKQAGLLFAHSIIYNQTAGIFGFTSTLINMTFHEIYEWISYSVALSAALRRNGAKKWLWLFLTRPSAPPLIECAERLNGGAHAGTMEIISL